MANPKKFNLSKKSPLEIFRSNATIKKMIVDGKTGELTDEQTEQMKKLSNITLRKNDF
jgi:hypothetical protein